ncbi:hypothetical protein KM043_004346 [Ampulex compressa]|nr:hypothetical protein KM043_004346 [Ampulex compressa]
MLLVDGQEVRKGRLGERRTPMDSRRLGTRGPLGSASSIVTVPGAFVGTNLTLCRSPLARIVACGNADNGRKDHEKVEVMIEGVASREPKAWLLMGTTNTRGPKISEAGNVLRYELINSHNFIYGRGDFAGEVFLGEIGIKIESIEEYLVVRRIEENGEKADRLGGTCPRLCTRLYVRRRTVHLATAMKKQKVDEKGGEGEK